MILRRNCLEKVSARKVVIEFGKLVNVAQENVFRPDLDRRKVAEIGMFLGAHQTNKEGLLRVDTNLGRIAKKMAEQHITTEQRIRVAMDTFFPINARIQNPRTDIDYNLPVFWHDPKQSLSARSMTKPTTLIRRQTTVRPFGDYPVRDVAFEEETILFSIAVLRAIGYRVYYCVSYVGRVEDEGNIRDIKIGLIDENTQLLVFSLDRTNLSFGRLEIMDDNNAKLHCMTRAIVQKLIISGELSQQIRGLQERLEGFRERMRSEEKGYQLYA